MYSTFAKKTTSEKLTVAWIEPSQRLVSNWTIHAGSVWKTPVQYWTVGVFSKGAKLSVSPNLASISAGKFFFDDSSKTLYVQLLDSTSPKLSHTEVVYRLFFADGPIDLPFDLEDGRVVPYLPYLSGATGGGSSFDPNNPQIPIEGSGKLDLQNDGFFANIFDRFTWQTKRAAAFSVSRAGDKLKLYEGLVTSKSFNGTSVSFGLKDSLYRLRSQLPLPLFSEADGRLSDALIGTPKRRIYGRVAGLKAESLDQQLEGYLVTTIDGSDFRTSTPVTFSITTASDLASASSTDAKKELCVGDSITINEVDFKIKTLSRRELGMSGETDVTFSQPVSTSQLRVAFTGIDTSRLNTTMHLSVSRLKNGSAALNSALFGISPVVNVQSTYFDVALDTAFVVGTVTLKVSADELCVTAGLNDTAIQLSEVSKATKVSLTARVKPLIPYRRLNRQLFIAHHALHEVSETVTKVKRGTLFELSSVSGLSLGDSVVFDGTKVNQIVGIDPVANTISTATAVNPLPQAGESVVRVAVQDVKFNNRSFTPLRDYSVSNLNGGSTCKLSPVAERDSFPSEALGSVVWQNGAKVVVASGDLFATFHGRDWVRPTDESTWYEVEEKFSDSIVVLKEPYGGTSGVKATTANKPTYIGDKSNVLINTYGVTFDGEPSGQHVRTASDAVKHLLTEAGIAEIDDTSFSLANELSPYLVSYAIPEKARGNPPTFRELINDFNSSVLGVTFISNEFRLMYRPLSAQRSSDSATYLTGYDVLDFKQKADSSTIYRRIIANYRPQDLDPITEEPTALATEKISNYVDNAGVEGQAYNVDLYLYDTLAAETIAARLMFFNELPKTQLTLTGSLNLTQLFLTDLVLFRSDNLYARYGSSDSSIIGIVTASNKSGQGASVTISDLGNIFARTAVVAPNSTPDFDNASADERRFAGFITDTNGLVASDDDLGTNLIN
jgi:hypothetical protein